MFWRRFWLGSMFSRRPHELTWLPKESRPYLAAGLLLVLVGVLLFTQLRTPTEVSALQWFGLGAAVLGLFLLGVARALA